MSEDTKETKREPNKKDEEWMKELNPTQYAVTRQGATEPPFTGQYWDAKEAGTYRCVCCGEELFSSETKYDSGSGWPSFYTPVDDENVEEVEDLSQGMRRTEVVCSNCSAHLGHVFPDGPEPTGLRYCINSAALDFESDEESGEGGGTEA